jgi:ferredoxin/flavodoxin---NADP+ reductase
LSENHHEQHLVAIIGAGPAGLFAARQLANAGAHVFLFNRDLKPGGLAEYGIYPDKHKMKEGLRKQFRQIMALPQIEYFGGVTVSESGDISLADLRQLGFSAVLVTVGAQGTKWQGLPGEDLRGVYHAKDLVYHYNRLPPFSVRPFAIGKRVAIIGVGNVMLDIAHYTVRDQKVDEVIAVARRGPAEVKYTKPELELVAANLDLGALDTELERVRPVMEAVGQDVEAVKQSNFLAALTRALPKISDTRLRFQFLASPSSIVGDDDGNVAGLEVEDTTLVPRNGDTKAKGLGTHRVIPVDTVVFAIGDRVDETFGLPTKGNEFVKNPNPLYPVDGKSYEAFDPEAAAPIPGLFVAGWSREASTGLVGAARKDGTNGAEAVAQYLQTVPLAPASEAESIRARLALLPPPVVSKPDWERLEKIEQAEAERRGLEEFKFATNEEMLQALGLAIPAPAGA